MMMTGSKANYFPSLLVVQAVAQAVVVALVLVVALVSEPGTKKREMDVGSLEWKGATMQKSPMVMAPDSTSFVVRVRGDWGEARQVYSAKTAKERRAQSQTLWWFSATSLSYSASLKTTKRTTTMRIVGIWIDFPLRR